MDFFRRFYNPDVRRAGMCNAGQPYICFISLEPILKDEDVAFAYHPASKDGSVPIHKKYMTPELRKQWMAHQKQDLIEASKTLEQQFPELKGVAVDLIERTFPHV